MKDKRKKIDAKYQTIYAFRNFDFGSIPTEARKDFMQIYEEFQSGFKPGFPTKQSLQRACDLLLYGEPKNDAEKNALKDIKRVWRCKNLVNDAKSEYCYVVYDILDKNLGRTIDDDVITNHHKYELALDFLIRHPGAMSAVQKLSKLRCKVRKQLNLPTTAYVGF